MRYLTIIFVLLALPQTAGAQAVTFEREGVEYRLELPSPAWRAVRRVDVHDHYDFVNGEDRDDGYLRIRRSLVEAAATPKELHLADEANLKLLRGYVECGACEGEPFSGALSGAVFSYEYTSGGRPVAGRIYYLRVDARTFYILHFTCDGKKLAAASPEADSIARSFRLR
jgi:hypothetical protein